MHDFATNGNFGRLCCRNSNDIIFLQYKILHQDTINTMSKFKMLRASLNILLPRCPSRHRCKLSTSSLACGTRHLDVICLGFTVILLPGSMACVALCSSWDSQDQFDTKVYGIVIQSLVEEPGPLPTLFMRTVIQVVCSPGPGKQKAEASATWNEYEG